TDGLFQWDITNDATFRINSTGNQTLSGVISGTGSLVKDSTGTLTVTGANSYTGDTTVDGGTLSLGDGTNNTTLDDAADVSVATGAVLDLNYAGTDTIDKLSLGGALQTPGTWGASGSGASFIDDTFFTGTGTLTISTGPPPTPYQGWTVANGLFDGDTLTTADIESPTPDGMTNLLEFAFGTDPNVSDNNSLTVTDGTTFTPGQPVVEEIFSGGNPVKLRYVRRKDHVAAGLTYTPMFTDSTGTTIPDPASPTPSVVSDDGGDYEVVQVPFPLFDSTGEKATALIAVVEVELN
ncbi:MAG: hypothetical protein HKN82_19070, partial [Akkermansiaceae bacterium]|nr:hypothetical protein [Akkermansiaceae bacterium]